MNITRKCLLCMCVVLIVMWLCAGCLSTDKPSDEVIQQTIIEFEAAIRNKDNIFYFYTITGFKTYKITNSFYRKSNGDNLYCVEVSYELYAKQSTLTPPYKDDECILHEKDMQFSFVKKGSKWYSKQGWEN